MAPSCGTFAGGRSAVVDQTANEVESKLELATMRDQADFLALPDTICTHSESPRLYQLMHLRGGR